MVQKKLLHKKLTAEKPKKKRKFSEMRKNTLREERDHKIIQFYTRGMTMLEVSKKMKLLGFDASFSTVQRCIDAQTEAWRNSNLNDFHALKMKELIGINQAEAIAWEEFDLSTKKMVEVENEDGSKSQKEVRVAGSTKWHEQALRCKEIRMKLLGLVKDVIFQQNNNLNQTKVTNIWQSVMELTPDPLQIAIEELHNNVKGKTQDGTDRTSGRPLLGPSPSDEGDNKGRTDSP